MDLHFHQETKEIWREYLHQEDCFAIELEGVVPDVNDDVGRVASIRSTLLLKSKELDGRMLRIGGEAETVVLYITENADRVASVKLNRAFTHEIELPDGISAQEAQAVLCVKRAQARILNPRKLAVDLELACTCSAFCREEAIASCLPEQSENLQIFGREESRRTQVISAVSEKSFALTENFLFPQGKAEPTQILSAELCFKLGEQSRIGTRMIVKGTMELRLSYAAAGVCYPLQQSFSTQLSQILDPGVVDALCCTVTCQPTALYLELGDGIGGQKTLSCEVHGLLQLVCRSETEIRYLSDAYAAAMPMSCSYRTLTCETAQEMEKRTFKAAELFSVSEDCADVLAVYPMLTKNERELSTEIDVIYRSRNGDLAAVKRQLSLKGEEIPAGGTILSAVLTRADLTPEGEGIQAALEAEVLWQRCGCIELDALDGAILDEEHPYDLNALPAVTLVRTDGESLWELARCYHSCVEAIEDMNGSETAAGKMLIIPRV